MKNKCWHYRNRRNLSLPFQRSSKRTEIDIEKAARGGRGGGGKKGEMEEKRN